MSIRSLVAPCLLASLVGSLALTGCKKEEEQPSAEEIADAEANKPAIDPNIAKAVAAASAKPAAPAGGDAPGGPPPRGIFGPGEADKQIKRGAPAIVTLGSAGSEPRVQLTGSSIKPGTKIDGAITIAVTGGPQKPVPFEFGVSIVAKADEGATGVADAVATVNSVKAAVDQVPPPLATQLNKLKGSRVEFQVDPNGAGRNFVPVVSKAAQGAQGDQSVRGLSDALATITIPYPNEPVGNGAFWMATTREGVMGLDLVTYRLVRVQRATPGEVTLTVGTKRYAAGTSFNLAGLEDQGKFTLDEFRSMADGTVMLAVGQPVPHKALLKLSLLAGLIPEGGPEGQLAHVQVQGQARFSFPTASQPAPAQAAPGARPAPPAQPGATPRPVAPAQPAAPAPPAAAARPAAPAQPATPTAP